MQNLLFNIFKFFLILLYFNINAALSEEVSDISKHAEENSILSTLSLRSDFSLNNEEISILLITHNMGVISEICDSVAVMKYGEFLETGDTYNILVNPQMDYSRNLISSVPRIDKKLDRILEYMLK